MKIIQQNENMMILKDRVGVWSFLLGMLFVAVGLIAIFSPQTFNQSPPWWLGLIFILLGLSSIFLGKNTTITINKTSKKVLVHQKGFFKTTDKEYSFEQIKEIRIHKETRTTGKETSRLFSLIFVLNDGQEIRFGSASSFYRCKRKIAEKISGFMNIPLQEDFPPSIKNVTDVIQKMIEKSKNKEF
ncbi:MAG: hypothetical protein ABIJ28_01650 [Patescibacteria group bacterium]